MDVLHNEVDADVDENLANPLLSAQRRINLIDFGGNMSSEKSHWKLKFPTAPHSRYKPKNGKKREKEGQLAPITGPA